MTSPKFSEVFRHAADNLCATNESEDRFSTYTCDRIVKSYCELEGQKIALYHHAGEILDYYPLVGIPALNAFDEFPPGIERQSARFLWLCMLAEIAESEGN